METALSTQEFSQRLNDISPVAEGWLQVNMGVFQNESFKLVVMDPPHIHSSGSLFRMTMDYGKLDKESWAYDISKGVDEAFRVLENKGVFIFKWNETQIKKHEVLRVIKQKPLFGHPVLSKVPTHWFTFMKLEDTNRLTGRQTTAAGDFSR